MQIFLCGLYAAMTQKLGDGVEKKGLFSSKSTEFPTQPGIYTQRATVSGNYSCEKITRTIVIN